MISQENDDKELNREYFKSVCVKGNYPRTLRLNAKEHHGGYEETRQFLLKYNPNKKRKKLKLTVENEI